MNDFNIFSEIFKILNIEYNDIDDLFNVTIDMDTLKDPQIIEQLILLVPKCKNLYNSNFLTCLHSNSTIKQKLPAINFIRQILKCNKYKLKGYYICQDCNKATGRKILKRLYKIIPL
jgi:hypothetical protein